MASTAAFVRSSLSELLAYFAFFVKCSEYQRRGKDKYATDGQ
ncbi:MULTISPECIES: hypothetical protein [Oscillatoriales]|nr:MULTISPECIES: hypothetical protein [Oscillatoriales]